MQRPSLLIVCYTFPPAPGIGGRRWAKFAKYLFRKGNETFVVTANSRSHSSDWEKDIVEYKERILALESSYPYYLTIMPKTLFEKVMYRLSLLYLKILVKGNYYDRSVLWKKELLAEVSRLIKEKNIKNLVISCAPFRMSYDLLELKELYPELNIIVDFRDPWMGSVLYGMETISPARVLYERELEKKVIEKADYVITVADEMTDYFKTLLETNKQKIFTVHNGYDTEDFSEIEQNAKKDSSTLKFIFTGSLYDKTIHHVSALNNGLNFLEKNHPEIYANLSFEFYGQIPKSAVLILKDHKCVKVLGRISNKEIYSKMREADVCMTFLTDEITYCFNTKFYEYLSQGKTMAIFSKKGSASDFIVGNQMGYAIEPQQVESKLVEIYNDFRNKKLLKVKDYDITQHHVKSIANVIDKLLI